MVRKVSMIIADVERDFRGEMTFEDRVESFSLTILLHYTYYAYVCTSDSCGCTFSIQIKSVLAVVVRKDLAHLDHSSDCKMKAS